MRNRGFAGIPAIATLFMCAGLAPKARAQHRSPATGTDSKEKVVIAHASGTFDVRVTRSHPGTGPVLGRMTLDKQSHGDRERTSQGEMLTAGTPVKATGAYVAIERVTGRLKGRKKSSGCNTAAP
jgi:hypothetical protein